MAPVGQRRQDLIIDPGTVHLGAVEESPGCEGIVKGVPPIDEMGRVVNQLGGIPILRQQPRQRWHVERQWHPRMKRPPIGPGVLPRHHIGAMGYRGITGGVGVVKGQRLTGQPVQVRRLDPVVRPVRTNVIVAQRIDDAEDDIHVGIPPLALSW